MTYMLKISLPETEKLMILEKNGHVMAAPRCLNKNCKSSIETHGTILCDFCLPGSGIVDIDYLVVYCLCVVLDHNKILKKTASKNY